MCTVSYLQISIFLSPFLHHTWQFGSVDMESDELFISLNVFEQVLSVLAHTEYLNSCHERDI